MKRLIFLGGANAFFEIIDIVHSINALSMTYDVVGILDDDKSLHGKSILGIPVLGSLEDARCYEDAYFVFAIGSYKNRMIRPTIIERLNIPKSRFETLVHPHSKIYPEVAIGNGCIIHRGVTICSGAEINDFCIITFDAVIAPNVQMDKYAMVTTKACVLTAAKIGSCAFVGVNSIVGEGAEIGLGSVVVMGSVVFKGRGEGAVLHGNPAKMLYREKLQNGCMENSCV